MLKKQQIVYVANDWFGDNKTSAHHIAEELARENTLLYVVASGQRAPRASGRDLGKILRILRRAFAKPRLVADNIYLFTPVILPFHRYGAVRRLNRILLRSAIRRACRSLGFERPLLWLVLPHFASVASDLDTKGVVYYCVDEYASQPNVDASRIREMEGEVLDRADVVFAVSEELVERKRERNPRAYLSRHGVDVAHFREALDPGLEPADDIAGIRRPIAGFFGLIEDWIDLSLIETAARALPDVSFAMIGRVVQPLGGLDRLPNVHFLGQKPYADLPRYLKAFDVGILPYRLNEQVLNSNPKKLREYLAGGKPVVSVRVREVENYAEFARIADDPEQFVQAIREAIETDNEGIALARAAAMENESWEARVETICGRVAEHITEVHNE